VAEAGTPGGQDGQGTDIVATGPAVRGTTDSGPDWQDGQVTDPGETNGDRRRPARRARSTPDDAIAVSPTGARTRVRMSAAQRREQLITIGRQLFAERGFDATSVEEVAARAKVSKPVVYEHFGGKEGLYAVVVDREVRALLDRIAAALTAGHPRELLEQAALALLDYIEEEPHGFRVLVRESPVLSPAGNFSSVMNDVAHQVEHILGAEFKQRGLDPKFAELYSQALVGMVALVGQWWREARKPKKEMVAAHLVNLAWNGLSHLEAKPVLLTRKTR
jgi:AcrR family transcriptional regulator